MFEIERRREEVDRDIAKMTLEAQNARAESDKKARRVKLILALAVLFLGVAKILTMNQDAFLWQGISALFEE